MTTPLVSVVIPAYNNAEHIRQAVESVLDQTFPHIEVIIGDHSSTDGTWELLQPYASDPRVTLFRTPAGGGAERNWNAVTDRAVGRYLKLVCGDDLLHPEALQQQVADLEANPGAGLAASRRIIIDASGRTIIAARGLDGLRGLVPGRIALRRMLRSGTNILGEPACVTLRRDLLVAAGGWDATHPYLIDSATYAAVLRDSALMAQPASLASFRLSGSQWSVRLARQQAAQARAFHRALRAQDPMSFSRADLFVGNVRATILALGRRLIYFALARRLRGAPIG